MEGLILKSVGSWYDILDADRNVHKGRLKGKFKLNDSKTTNPIAVGDKVEFEVEENQQTVVISKIYDRYNYIIRKSAHKTEHTHIIAANIDEAFLVVTLVSPQTSLGFIDRFLVSAESFRIPVTIIFNKIDLYDQKTADLESKLIDIYQAIGYKCFPISAEQNLGVDQILKYMQNKKVLISGHSGVGKSTLMNRISPSLSLKTLPISNFANKGVHTTTFAEMYALENNTYLIDTPGIKEFGLVEMEKYEISHFFPEMRTMIGNCKFNTCLHINEPGCVVKQAVADDTIAESRYKSYLSMLQNDDNRK